MLTPREGTTHQLNGGDAINAHSILVVCVKVWPMMWCTGFGIHANNNPKKARKFWHELIIPQGCGVIVCLCCGGRGRDASYPAPPAQIPACGTTAPGSCLGS